jgi:hypothetical protein
MWKKMDLAKCRLSSFFGLIGAASCFLSAGYAVFYSMWRSGIVEELPFSQTQAISWYILGGILLIAGLLGAFGSLRGKLTGAAAMLIAGGLALITMQLNGWFAVIFLFSGAFLAAKEEKASTQNISNPQNN